ncbi:hypothetical protein LXE92_25135 [Burkholderia contaminans]|nr:hypothetical protein [Burkholderia contaminans]WFN11636.1 hypothetical protein LXE92_25135 [Burkholderia contaminans]
MGPRADADPARAQCARLAARDPAVATQQFEELVRRKLAARRLRRARQGAGA